MWRRLWPLGLNQFLSTFNDYAFRITVIMVTIGVAKEHDENTAFAIISLASMCFMLPYIILPGIAGWVADRYPKRSVIIFLKYTELFIMFIGAICLNFHHFLGWLPLLIVLFFLSTQSTFLLPAYFGILPETFTEERLSKANGLIAAALFTGLILGSGSGIMLNWLEPGSIYIGLPFIIIALIGILNAIWIVPTLAPEAQKSFQLLHVFNSIRELRYIFLNRAIFLCVFGAALFWMIIILLSNTSLIFVKYDLNTDPSTIYPLYQVAMAVGTGLGCLIAGIASGKKIEFGLVPIGAYGCTLCCLILSLTSSVIIAGLALFSCGFFSGFFVLPLMVYLQEKSPRILRGKLLASTNAFHAWTMFLLSALTLYLCAGTQGPVDRIGDMAWLMDLRRYCFNLSARDLYFGAVGILLLSSCISFFLLPDFLLRMLILLMTRFLYRIKIIGREQLPKEGPTLLLSNHVSVLDGCMISILSSRIVHFPVNESYYKKWWVRPFTNWARLIPFPSNKNPKELQEALKNAQEVLKKGEVLCIFPEEQPNPNGSMGPFKRGFLKVIPESHDIPIIPIYLDFPWGSVFPQLCSIKIRRPDRLPYPVTIAVGAKLQKTISARQAHAVVAELGANSESIPHTRELSLPQRVIRLAHRRPFSILLEEANSQSSYTTLSILIKSYAMRQQLGPLLTKEERYIGVILPSSSASVITAITLMLTDKIPVFLNFTSSKEAMEYALEKCNIRHIISSKIFLHQLNLARYKGTIFVEDLRDTISPFKKLKAVGFACIPAWLARYFFFPKLSGSLHNTATVLFSSGSSGMPKGVVLSQHNLNTNVNSSIRVLGLEREDRVLASLPMFHSFGFMTGLWMPLLWGIPVVYYPNPMDTAGIGETVAKYKLTVLFATPSFLQQYIRKCQPEQFESLRLLITGAEKLQHATATAFQKKFHLLPTEGYGCTELSPVVSINLPASLNDVGKKHGKNGSVGKPLPGIAVKVTDVDTGEDLDIEQEGLLRVKGGNVMQGYLDEQEKTAEVLQNGWYNTGDLARIDKEGYISITGRLSRFSKIAGEMVSHGGIEEAIQQILDNNETCVVISSVPDSKKGERLVALHSSLPISVRELIRSLRQKGMPNLWVPKENDFYSIEHIPLLGSGKLDLKAIKILAMDLSKTN